MSNTSKVIFEKREIPSGRNTHFTATSPSGKTYSILDSKNLMETSGFDEKLLKYFDFWEAILKDEKDRLNIDVVIRAKDQESLAEKILNYEKNL